MIWHRKRHDPDPEVEEARRKLEEALGELQAAQRDDAQVDDLARKMHEMRRTNRFAEVMRRALGAD